MTIRLTNIAKKYRYEWIFKGVDAQFQSERTYALLGANGSGKSTLLKILSGHLSPSIGKIEFLEGGNALNRDDVYRKVAFAAPYMELIEEFTLTETLNFQRRFKPFKNNASNEELIDLLALASAKNKAVKYFSSGMKQRLKLLLAIYSDAPILLLDEPTTNLDVQGVAWYRDLILHAAGRIVVIASNILHDYDFCHETLSLSDYK